MAFETELIFNNVEMSHARLGPLHDAVHTAMREQVPWSFMLKYLYLVSSEDDIIDLGLSKEFTAELKRLHGNTPIPLSTLVSEESDAMEDADAPWYFFRWDGDSGKWYESEAFVAWLSAFCDSGYIFQLVHEQGGGLWGWEFNNGKYRALALQAKGRWKRPASL